MVISDTIWLHTQSRSSFCCINKRPSSEVYQYTSQMYGLADDTPELITVLASSLQRETGRRGCRLECGFSSFPITCTPILGLDPTQEYGGQTAGFPFGKWLFERTVSWWVPWPAENWVSLEPVLNRAKCSSFYLICLLQSMSEGRGILTSFEGPAFSPSSCRPDSILRGTEHHLDGWW